MKIRIQVFLGNVVAFLAMLLLCHSIALGQDGTNNSNEIQLDKSDVLPVYTNYARVTGTADEVVIDFGMFAAPEGKMPPIKVHHQAVMNYYTLKRLAASLQATLEQHERLFGPVELDINKRAKQ